MLPEDEAIFFTIVVLVLLWSSCSGGLTAPLGASAEAIPGAAMAAAQQANMAAMVTVAEISV